jgi:hypothetical protein
VKPTIYAADDQYNFVVKHSVISDSTSKEQPSLRGKRKYSINLYSK